MKQKKQETRRQKDRAEEVLQVVPEAHSSQGSQKVILFFKLFDIL